MLRLEDAVDDFKPRGWIHRGRLCARFPDRRAANDENARTDYEVERRYENGRESVEREWRTHGSIHEESV